MTLDKIIEKIDSNGYYSFSKILKHGKDARLWFIVGQRRIGKTLTCLHLACELFIQDAKQTMWVRNKKVELEDDGFINTFLNAAREFGWCPDTWVCKKDGVWTAEKGGDQVILFQSVSTFSNRRGNMTPDVELIIFDEFMPEDRRYPKQCHKGLMSLTKTVLSGRESARCICLSNYISCANPYFVGFRIFPKKGYDVTYFKDKSIALEICHGYNCSILEDSGWNVLYKAGGYGDYASEEEDELFKLICKMPNGASWKRHIIVQDVGLFTYYEKDGYYYWKELQGEDVSRAYKFTSHTTLMAPGIHSLKYIEKFIKEGIDIGRFRYVTPNVMYAVMSEIYKEI